MATLIVPPIVCNEIYLRASLEYSPHGFIIRLAPLRAWFVCVPSPINAFFCHGPNTPYPVFTPLAGRSGYYQFVHHALITNLVPGESAGRILHLSSFFDELDNDQGSRESLGISAWVHPVAGFNLPPTRARDLVPAVEVTRNEETLDSELNNLASDSEFTYEDYLVLEERMGRVGSRLSEEKIMQNIRKTSHTTTTTSTNEGPDICVICQAQFEDDESVGVLSCGHEYHVQCIKKWLRRINNCPLCKATAVS